MRRRFFVERFDENTAALLGEAAHHLGRVLRAEPGQLYELSDGRTVWLARIERVEKDSVRFALVERIPAREPALRSALLLSLVKFDRFEWALEKATELGVAEIIPLAAARSEKALLAAAGKRAERWRRILLESSQQSRRLRVPTLHPAARPAIAFAEAGARLAMPVILSERPEAPVLRTVFSSPGVLFKRSARLDSVGCKTEDSFASESMSAALAIGPEGGWTDEELDTARVAGFSEASLGENILRTETAVIAALAIIHYALGESSELA